MKKIKFLSVCFILLSAFLTSCSGDVEPLDPAVDLTPDPPAGGFFKVDFSDQTFQATTTVAYISSGNILISGVKSTGQTISIALDGAIVGTYNTDDNIISYTPSPNSEYDYVNINELPDGNFVNNGSVIITEIDTEAKTISGTFSFTGYWSDYTDENPPTPIEFTNGSFTIPYVSQELNPDCATPTNLTVQRNQDITSATLNWNAGGTETSWEVVVVEAGFPVTEGTSYTTTSKPFSVANLTNDSYDFYVRAICSESETSSWSEKINLEATSQASGFYIKMKVDGTQITLAEPNASITTTYNSLTFMIVSTNGVNTFILNLVEPQGVGVYPYATEIFCSYTQGFSSYTSNYSNSQNSTGNITITELDEESNTIKGTFNFIGKTEDLTQSKTITEGEFYLSY